MEQDEDAMELEMRIDGLGDDGQRRRAETVLRTLDPALSLRVDSGTGIAHLRTTRQVLEIEDALVAAGFSVTAATG